ncbi:MAG: TonB-dependent receptor [Rhodothermales bacterium]|nr:TonB-dependent receptor [Rhodothermales bacterium]MBO6778645.1 TonB-dependent receptor [Rhodothermales bacterium]
MKSFTLLVGLLAAISSSADPLSNIGTIEGRVVGADTGTPLATATVAIWALPDSTLVTGAIADESGAFEVSPLDPGSYYLEASFVGYAPFRSEAFEISTTSRKISLNQIRLQPDSAELEGVEVTAERAEVAFEIDRTVYNTKDQISAAGGNATDLLQNIPSVEVDIDGNISLRGNQNVGILINGRPAPARGDALTAFLQQLSAEMIDRIEVIPNPSAKFDPEGMAGMLNIVLKEGSKLGTSGGVTLGAGSTGEYNASGNLNLQKGKLTVFSNYGFRSSERNSSGFTFRENRFLDPLTFLEQNSFGGRESRSHVGNVNADYAIDGQTTLSGSALLSTRSGSSNNANQYLELAQTASPTGRYDRLTFGNGDGSNMDFSSAFRRVLEANQNEVTAELRFNRSTNTNLDAFEEQSLGINDGSMLGIRDRSRESLDIAENEWTGQLDVIKPVGGLKLETGYRGTLSAMDNTLFSEFLNASGAFAADVTRNNTFDYQEQVHAAYGLLSGSIGIFDVQGGVRVEQVLTDFDLATTGETFNNNYRSVFPSGIVSWKPSFTRQVKLSYSKRVNRPRTSMLNPFTTFSDPQNLFVGNPFLKPQYTHAFELSLQQFSRKGSLSLSPYFRRTVDEMERFKTVSQDGTSTTTWRNFDQSDSYGAELVGSLRFGRKFSGFASFNAYRVVTDASSLGDDLASSDLTWSTRANLSWNVREGLDMQAFWFYRAPREVAQGRIASFQVANLSLRQKLLNDKASLSLRVSDPLNQMGFTFELDSPTFYQLGERNWESRRATLTFTYNFGQAPKQQRRNAQRGDEGMGDMGIN